MADIVLKGNLYTYLTTQFVEGAEVPIFTSELFIEESDTPTIVNEVNFNTLLIGLIDAYKLPNDAINGDDKEKLLMILDALKLNINNKIEEVKNIKLFKEKDKNKKKKKIK